MGLEGRKVGIAAERKADMIAKLIEKNGGKPSTFPIQGKQVLNEKTAEKNVSKLLAESFHLILLTTGIGAETLEKAAQQLNLFSDFIGKLEKSTLAVRGSKTRKWLKKHSLTASYVSEDGTMENVLDSLAEVKRSDGKHVFLQTYDQDDVVIKNKLESIGYTVYLSKPYLYKKPDFLILNNLRQHIMDQTLDAVVFTSKTQVINLFDKERERLVYAFNDKVKAVAVGKVTAYELEKNGVSHVIHPTNQKMGAMVIELRNYFNACLNH